MSQEKNVTRVGLPVFADVEDVARDGDRPNLLVISMDQLRGDFLGINGHPITRTPHLDQLALSGVNFRSAMSECPVCCPARRILMTGLDPYGIHMNYNRDLQPFPEGPKLAELLGSGGYQTHAVGKMHTWPPRDRMGFGDIEVNEEGRTAGHEYPDDYQLHVQEGGYGPLLNAHGMGNNQYGCRESPVPEPYTSTGWTADRAMRFLRRRDPSRPFFLYVSFDKPHPPLTPPREFLDLYRHTTFPEPVRGAWVDNKPMAKHRSVKQSQNWDQYTGRPEVIQESLRGYAACITHIDSRIGQLLGTLRETGVLANTWIMVVADHGDHCFDHDLVAKGDFFTGSANIPYLLVPASTALENLDPACISRRDQDHAVGLQDVMPTLLELAGVEIPDSVTGRSLLPLLREDSSEFRRHLCGNIGPLYGVSDGRYVFQWDSISNQRYLFDLWEDPKNERDLADREDHRGQVEALEETLVGWMEANGDERAKDGALKSMPRKTLGQEPGYRSSSWNNRGWRP